MPTRRLVRLTFIACSLWSVPWSVVAAQMYSVRPIFDVSQASCDCGLSSCDGCDLACDAFPQQGTRIVPETLWLPDCTESIPMTPEPAIPPSVPDVPQDDVTQTPLDQDQTLTQPPAPVVDAEDLELDLSSSPDFGTFASTFGAVAGGIGAPSMIGDIFSTGPTQFVLGNAVDFTATANGFVVSPGDQFGFNASIVYELTGGTSTSGNDFFSVGSGHDTTGDGFADTYDLGQPTPPSANIAAPPGPEYTFEGTATEQQQGGEFSLWDINYGYVRGATDPGSNTIVLPDPGTLVVGRVKIAEGTSPLPRHRVFFHYSLFDNVPLIENGLDVRRFNPGFERTFWEDQASIEVRFPFLATLNSSIVADGSNDLSHIEFGNIFLAAKFFLLSTSAPHRPTALNLRTRVAWDVSAGMSMTVPTADDVVVNFFDGTPLVRIGNESVHLMPFVGWLGQTRTGLFTQGFLQLDVDVNGNPVAANFQNLGLVDVGRVQGTTMLYFDIGFGKVIPLRNRRLTAVTPMLEFHLNRSLQSADFVQAGRFRVGQPKQDQQTLNFVVGNTFHLGRQTNITCGYSAPIGNGMDQMFDGELRLLWNRFF